MHKANNKETTLEHIMKFTLNIQGIIQLVQAFIPFSDHNTSINQFGFFLSIPQLYQVNATIRIQQFIVTIGDKNMKKMPQNITKATKLRFLKKQILIMQLCAILKSLEKKVETKLNNVILFKLELDSNLDNDNKISLYNANKIYLSIKTQKNKER